MSVTREKRKLSKGLLKIIKSGKKRFLKSHESWNNIQHYSEKEFF